MLEMSLFKKRLKLFSLSIKKTEQYRKCYYTCKAEDRNCL